MLSAFVTLVAIASSFIVPTPLVTHVQSGTAKAATPPYTAPRTRARFTDGVAELDTETPTCYPVGLPGCDACEFNEEWTEYYGEPIWLCTRTSPVE